MRLTTDIFEYCHENVPKWNTISISGYHIREKGCSAVQEVAFTLSNAIAYVEAALERGLKIDEFAPRLAFFFNCHNNVFQEIAKFRAVRRMWAKIVDERFGAENPKSMQIRFHTQTGGVTLQAQQPEVNIIRVALQGFAAVAGGTQSLHTNGFDEALALPTERSARIALRTQQVLAYESGVAETVDPFAGSYFVESLTDEVEARAWELMEQGRRAGRLGRGAGVHAARDRGVGAQLPRALALRPGRDRRRQQIRHRPGRRRRHPQGRPGVRAAPAGPPQGLQGEPRPGRRSRPSWRASATSPAATATCCTRSAPPSPPTPRSARSAARCATSSANTRAAPSSKAGRRQRRSVALFLDQARGPGCGSRPTRRGRPRGRGRSAGLRRRPQDLWVTAAPIGKGRSASSGLHQAGVAVVAVEARDLVLLAEVAEDVVAAAAFGSRRRSASSPGGCGRTRGARRSRGRPAGPRPRGSGRRRARRTSPPSAISSQPASSSRPTASSTFERESSRRSTSAAGSASPSGRLDRVADRLQVLAVDPARAAEEAADRFVLGPVEEDRLGGLAVAPGAADLLVVGVDRVRRPGVEDEAHVRLVDPHAEGGGRDDHLDLVGHEAVLELAAVLRRQPRVVGLGVDARAPRAPRRAPRSPCAWRCRRCPAWAPRRPPRPAPPLSPSPR